VPPPLAPGKTTAEIPAAPATPLPPAKPAKPTGSAGPDKPGKSGEEVSSGTAYGPDDPGYGPPDADWYERRKRERELELEREEEEFLAEAAGEEPPSRSVFEPLARSDSDSGAGAAEPKLTSLDLLLNADDGDDYEEDPLTRVKDMYLAAEAVSDSDLDRRFEELLERQRNLVGAYFRQSRPSMEWPQEQPEKDSVSAG
jgi:hypothetical protein